MLKSSFAILAALVAWAASSLIVILGMPNLASVTDGLDLLGEVLFTLGILLMFVRMGLSAYRNGDTSRSAVGSTKQG
ncbi:hypothetical protein [Asaia bogorensis]|uniref:hypothetical protein n=1 Tax=Asaia bogorensis TaxID=91915 RepID=UPI000EFAB777|nr:hypothetical protein [Asaia bogorensis]